jgi:succinate dehydrogenase flavin-adding protein (antitoxin of CptAB toxin-antitoxin module)
MTNTQSTLANEMPKVGKDSAPPEFLSSVDPDFKPKDKEPGNTENMTGGTQESSDLHVGEIEGGSFRIEPLRRTGEDKSTMRARLTCPFFLCFAARTISPWSLQADHLNLLTDQSRKRGTLESDLLLSTFADAHLEHMSVEQLKQYDLFLDENDWDIYYWATQEPMPTSLETAEGSTDGKTKNELPPSPPASGEWAQTVGTFKPAYRPVPQRWKDSEILTMLRDHVESKRSQGMAFMPRLKTFDH